LDRLNMAVGEVRRISHNLRPTMLDDLGLPAALEHLGREFAVAGNDGAAPLEVRLHTAGTLYPLPEAYATAPFRITQEALTNVLRHAHATLVDIMLDYAKDSLCLTITDNGVGLDFSDVQQNPQLGIGLRNKRERMAALAGTLTCHAGNRGTSVQAWLPLPRTAPPAVDGPTTI